MLYEVITNAQDEGSIKDLIYHVHRTAAAVRDRLSWDAWSVLSRLEQACKTLRSRENVDWVDVEQCLSEQITSLSAFSRITSYNVCYTKLLRMHR